MSDYPGQPVSDGVAVGVIDAGRPAAIGQVTPDQVRAAFAAVAAARSALADSLRAAGRAAEADIVSIGALIAADPALADPAAAAVRDGADADAAITAAASAQAAIIEALDIPELAERAADVRQVATAVLEYLSAENGARARRPVPEADGSGAPPGPDGSGAPPGPDWARGPLILIRREVDPAELIQLAEAGLAGAVSVTGGASSHAAIIARGLGIPMLAGADPAVLTVPGGTAAILDADAGRLLVDPSGPDLEQARARLAAGSGPVNQPEGAGGSGQVVPGPGGVVRTRDGEAVTVLCNVASAAETRLGLAAGAGGVGLVRTEVPFTSAGNWPDEAAHAAWLKPVLELLGGRPAVVRLLDFSGDKIPPFLRGRPAGLPAFLAEPGALEAQLRAVLAAGRGTRLAIMIPMVTDLGQVERVRAALAEAARAAGDEVPELGMMVEVAATARRAQIFASEVDFFSIGTNDLACDVLGLDRSDPRAGPHLAAEPAVLELIAGVTRAAAAAGLPVSVCGDAAADPEVLPLLIGLGVRRVSVPAARVGRVAGQIAALDAGGCARLVRRASSAAAAAASQEVR